MAQPDLQPEEAGPEGFSNVASDVWDKSILTEERQKREADQLAAGIQPVWWPAICDARIERAYDTTPLPKEAPTMPPNLTVEAPRAHPAEFQPPPRQEPEIRAVAGAGALTLEEWEWKMGDGRNLVRARARRTSQGPVMAMPLAQPQHAAPPQGAAMTPEGAQLQFPEGPAMALPLAQPQNAAPPQGAAVTPEGALLRSPEERAAIVRNLLHGTDGHHPNAAPPQGAAVTPEGALLRSPEEHWAAIVGNLLHGPYLANLHFKCPNLDENARWQGRSWWWQGHSWWWQGGWTGRDSSQWTDWQ